MSFIEFILVDVWDCYQKVSADAETGLRAGPDWAPSTYPFPATVWTDWSWSLDFGRGRASVCLGIGPVAQLVRAHA
jgi:hypothetical protein